MAAIQRNRGCTIRKHPAGFRVCMYKDEPGVYYDETGGEVGAEVARRAGFATDELEKARRKKAAMERARAQIEAEYADREEEVARDIEAASDAANVQIKHIGGGKYALCSAEGDRLTARPMEKSEAEQLLSDLQADLGKNKSATDQEQ